MAVTFGVRESDISSLSFSRYLFDKPVVVVFWLSSVAPLSVILLRMGLANSSSYPILSIPLTIGLSISRRSNGQSV